ncbi:MAG: hypothetical protein JXQ83_12170, partial [Candidatus Glassbacteria bacterium]|nr:hypothetical protein [Candidatus Glassbacteria bacterium]
LMAATLLPRSSSPTLAGGPGKEFLVGDVNYATEKGGDAEGGAWRVEVSSPGTAGEVEFLHAMEVFSNQQADYLTEALLIEEQGMIGVEIPAATVIFCNDSGAAGQYRFSTQGGHARKHLVAGMPPERKFTVDAEGREIRGVTTGAGTLVFQTGLKAPAELTITLE